MKYLIRLGSVAFLFWAFGFVWFANTLPGPAGNQRVDAVIVPTGGSGRIPRGLEVLGRGQAEEILVTGVDPEVKAAEFAAEYGVSNTEMECCVTLGFEASDTRGNAREAAIWQAEHDFASLRLVTTDWHMRRAAYELRRVLPDSVTVLEDAVPSRTSLGTLFLEYHKYLAAVIAPSIGLG